MNSENSNSGNGGEWDTLLTDRDELSEEEANSDKFIKPNIEYKLPAAKRAECREIVAEIKRFGVSQRQLLFLIQLLAMELEDVVAMRSIVKLIGERREETPLGLTDSSATPSGPKIIIE